MKSWATESLGANVQFLSGGTPSKDNPSYWEGDIPWVSSGEMTQRRIQDTKLHISSNGAMNGSRLIPDRTILAVVRGMSLATEFRVAITKRELAFNQDLKAIIPNKKLDSSFLFYYLLSQNHAIRDSASEAAHGTKKLDMPVLEQWPLPLPPLPIQRKIAAVLSAYDDLIENNNRRIAILEKMAEELYREWFVRLRFPGHEKVKIVKGVPEGWSMKPLPEIADITYGFPFDGSRFNADGIGKPIIRIRNIPDSITTDYTDEQADDKYIIRRGDLLVGMDGEFHINHWYSDNAYLVQRSCRIKAKEERLEGYLAKAIYAPVKYYESILQGATVGHLGAKHLNAIKLLVPNNKLNMNIFNSLLAQKVRVATSTNNLKQTRDRLLSRLMSGKIDVEKMDIRFPESMKEEVANA